MRLYISITVLFYKILYLGEHANNLLKLSTVCLEQLLPERQSLPDSISSLNLLVFYIISLS